MLNVVIPMAGAGSRFEKAGYTFPKPLIEVGGKPMIEVVVDNLLANGELAKKPIRFIFLVQKTHREMYSIDSMLKRICRPYECVVIEVDGITEGAACTVLLAESYINSEDELLISNSDQYVLWVNNISDLWWDEAMDGDVAVFESTHPKWSYVALNAQFEVIRVAEKDPISEHATVGIYYWKHGSDFVRAAKSMITKNLRVNGEFYVAPVINEAIAEGKRFSITSARRMWGLGTPEDLEVFLRDYRP